MTLMRPNFIERSPTVIEPAVKAAFEAALGKELFPGQLEQLLLNVATYRELLIRIGIQYAAEQNLVNYATGANLDQLGALLNTTRLAASAATVTLTFSRTGPTTSALTIPAGTQVRQPGSSITFATDAEATITIGSSSTTASATATTTGANSGGFVTGAITQLISTLPDVVTVTNAAASVGGADTESDDAFRTRIKLAPTQFSVAGSKGAYRFYTLSANASIIDVAVLGPDDRGGANPVTVDVYPLTNTGLPDAGLLAEVVAILDQDTIRPLTDIVNVAAPTEVNYTIDADITLLTSADQTTTEAALNAAATAYATSQAATLGKDIVRSQIIEALQAVEGVYSVTLNAPATTIAVAPNEWANNNGITITIAGTNAG